MSFDQFITDFIQGLRQTGWLEFIAVFAGIGSVWFSRKDNILVYPVGLINTSIYIYLSLKGNLFGEASVNFYYTVMSIYGWILWTREDQIEPDKTLQIRFSDAREWRAQLLFFGGFYLVIYAALSLLKQKFAPDAIPWADAFASATAYTGMWLMARKKVESWIWWIATNIASIPLYFVKGYVFTSVQFLILLILAIAGLLSWRQKALHARP
jgi:nicotinamide mononucleotide transporter